MIQVIGDIRKVELRDLLIGLSLTTCDPNKKEAFQIVAYATGLGELSIPNNILILEENNGHNTHHSITESSFCLLDLPADGETG